MSDAPRWPGADGSPGLDFSANRDTSGGGIYRDGGEPRGSSSATSVDVSSPTSPTNGEENPESEMESTAISVPSDRNQSAVEWASRPLGTSVPAPPRPVARPASPETANAGPEMVPVAPVLPTSAASAAGATTAAPMAPRIGSRRTRKARLRLARIDPWSVMKTTFLFAIAFGIMLIVIVYVLWSVIAGSGALESVNEFMTTLIGDQAGGEFRVESFINGSRILGFAAVLAAIDVVIITTVSTLFAFLYNLAATIMGGLEVTLAED